MSTEAEDLCDQALIHFQNGELERAEALWRRSAEMGSGRAFSNLAMNAEERGELEECRRLTIQAAQCGDSDSAFNVGLETQQAGDLEAALTWFEIGAAAGDGPCAFKLGFINRQLDRMEASLAGYRRAAALGDVPGTLCLMDILGDIGQFEEAFTLVDGLPTELDASAHILVAYTILNAGEELGLGDHLQAAAELGEPSGMYLWAEYLCRTGEFDAARMWHAKAIAAGHGEEENLDRVNALEALYAENRAEFALSVRAIELARIAYRDQKPERPYCETCWTFDAVDRHFCSQCGDEMFLRACMVDDGDVDQLNADFEIAWALYEEAGAAEGLPQLRRVAAQGHVGAWFALGCVYHSEGETRSARRAFEIAVASRDVRWSDAACSSAVALADMEIEAARELGAQEPTKESFKKVGEAIMLHTRTACDFIDIALSVPDVDAEVLTDAALTGEEVYRHLVRVGLAPGDDGRRIQLLSGAVRFGNDEQRATALERLRSMLGIYEQLGTGLPIGVWSYGPAIEALRGLKDEGLISLPTQWGFE